MPLSILGGGQKFIWNLNLQNFDAKRYRTFLVIATQAEYAQNLITTLCLEKFHSIDENEYSYRCHKWETWQTWTDARPALEYQQVVRKISFDFDH